MAREERFAIRHGHSESDIIRVARRRGGARGSKFPGPGGRFSSHNGREARMAQREVNTSRTASLTSGLEESTDRPRVYLYV